MSHHNGSHFRARHWAHSRHFHHGARFGLNPAHRHGHFAGGFGGSGLASWYSGRGGGFTAAHRSLPFGTMVRVTNRSNGRSCIVRINDRGPFIAGRVIDLSRVAARAIGVTGVSPVTLQRL